MAQVAVDVSEEVHFQLGPEEVVRARKLVRRFWRPDNVDLVKTEEYLVRIPERYVHCGTTGETPKFRVRAILRGEKGRVLVVSLVSTEGWRVIVPRKPESLA